jgi:outer membrane biosynthesis protein TonB
MATVRHLLAFAALLLVLPMLPQSKSVLEDQAYDHLNSKDFVNAYLDFDKLHARYPKEIDYEFKLGICCLYYPEKKPRAIEIFQEMKRKYKTLEVEVYLGKAYHMNYKFDEAIATLTPLVEVLMSSKKKEDKVYIDDVKMTIMNSENGRQLINNKVIADIDNIGEPINTPETEGVPIITADESMMMFTYVGKKSMGGKMNAQMNYDANGLYLSDVFISKKDATSGKWLPPEPVEALNTKGNDAAIAISPDGQTVFTFLSNNNNEGDIMMSKMSGGTFSVPVPLNANINTPEYWEGSCSISADGKYLYFSSERPNGFGGRDIYVSEMVNGDWGAAINMGPKINTPYDDDAPFIHPDGITLFFSSKGHKSIGGYDIMFTVKEGNDWIEPRSMGIPLNTVEDDSYYVINSKGDKGFFSSNRDAKGALGEQDIYMVTPGILGDKPVVALLKGTVYGDDKPLEATIDVLKLTKQEPLGPYFSNKETGHYLTALSPGYTYRIKIHAPGFNTVEEDFDIENLASFIEKTKDFYLYSSPDSAKAVAGVKKIELPSDAVLSEAPKKETEPVKQPEPTEPIAKQTEKEPVTTTEPAKQTEPEPVKSQEPTKEPEAVKDPEPAKKTEPITEPVVTVKKEPKKPKEPKPQHVQQPASEEESVVMSPCDQKLPDLNELKGKNLNDEQKYRTLMDLMGSYCADNLYYTVQIGAYRKPDNYKYTNLKDLGKVSSENYPDGITRFTQKQFNTLKDAEKQRQRAIARGQKDAWIVAFIDGKRYTLEDLIMVDFLGKPVN